jgi:hypothetical protein
MLKGMWFRLLQRHLHTHVYCSTIHKPWKQPRCPTTDKWIKFLTHRVSLCSPSWPQTFVLPNSASQMLGLHLQTTTSGPLFKIFKKGKRKQIHSYLVLFTQYPWNHKENTDGQTWWCISVIPATLGGGDQEDHCSRPAYTKVIKNPS